MRHAARTDANQGEIMKALRKVGVTVEYIKQPFDCIIFIPRTRETALLECKTEEGGFTKAQLEFMGRWPGRILVVRSPEDAVRQVIGEEAMK